MRDNFKESLKAHNMDLSGGGLKFSMKEVSDEEYRDSLRRGLVSVVNNSHANPRKDEKHHRIRRWMNSESTAVGEEVPAGHTPQ